MCPFRFSELVFPLSESYSYWENHKRFQVSSILTKQRGFKIVNALTRRQMLPIILQNTNICLHYTLYLCTVFSNYTVLQLIQISFVLHCGLLLDNCCTFRISYISYYVSKHSFKLFLITSCFITQKYLKVDNKNAMVYVYILPSACFLHDYVQIC